MQIVLGSINADLLFRVSGLPQPGETVLCPSYEAAAGGKGANQAAAAAKAGASTRFFGHVGADDHGERLRRGLADAGVDVEGLATSRAAPTGIAVIAIDDRGENSILVASGANLETRARQLDAAGLGPGTSLLCQNEIRPAETAAALARAKAAGAQTMLNLAPAAPLPPEVLAQVDVLVVNRLEALMAAGASDGAPAELARELAGRERVCVITLGARGTLVATPKALWQVPVLPIEPVDTTGAGDAFVGVLAAGLDRGLALLDALAEASVAGALTCTALGARSAQPDAASIAQRLPELAPAERLD